MGLTKWKYTLQWKESDNKWRGMDFVTHWTWKLHPQLSSSDFRGWFSGFFCTPKTSPKEWQRMYSARVRSETALR